MESLHFHEVFMETNIDNTKQPPAPDTAAPLVLCDKPKRVRRKTAFEIFAWDYGNKQECMGMKFNWSRNMIEVQAGVQRVQVEEADRYEEEQGFACQRQSHDG